MPDQITIIVTGQFSDENKQRIRQAAPSADVQFRGVDIVIDNLKRYQSGQPLRNVVDKSAGY